MNIEKIVEVALLFDQYKSLLTEKQREIVSLYYEEDYSLVEISDNLGVSRQGIYDTLKRSEKVLKEYESKLKLVEKLQEHEKNVVLIHDKIAEIKKNLKDKVNCEDLVPKLENIEDICEGMIK